MARKFYLCSPLLSGGITRGTYPGPRFSGYLGTVTRARGEVLGNTDLPVVTTRANWRCGARTRKGTPCRARAMPGKTRCRFHGGLSTGPKTREGRERIAEAQRRRWATKK
ncbi:HGGxSTG domain-containing protein [Pseudooceanicola sp.]|uniref:HGGxSTG domain-containing protein n=1 Tax=Pseudooceanicola sp. TaxID=1914328 RepID=UPI0026354CB7|nr:HGGxSTG domain-containing protein [Pseudooceanicola sp.]MDF1856491.1 HGGxSTG domain-containing protein [Pseudooceanicola sp.]